jgi:hypothetical protein
VIGPIEADSRRVGSAWTLRGSSFHGILTRYSEVLADVRDRHEGAQRAWILSTITVRIRGTGANKRGAAADPEAL